MTCNVALFAANPLLVLFITVGLGYFVGKARVGPIQLGGVCGTLIVALLMGQTGCQMHGELKDMAFALFIFAMGYSGGPQFFANLNRSSLRYMVLPLVEAVVVLAIALAAAAYLGFDPGTAAGLAAGAATESAVVGTAAEALKHLGLDAATVGRYEANIATAYTLTYLVGLISIVFFTSQIAPALLGIDLRTAAREVAARMEAASDDDVATQPALPRLIGRAYAVQQAAGMTVSQLQHQAGGRASVVKVLRGGASIELGDDDAVQAGDILAMVGIRSNLLKAAALIGPEVLLPEAHTDAIQLVEKQVVVNQRRVNGKTLGELARLAGARRLREVWVLEVRRSGLSLPITRSTPLQLGDVITIVGLEPSLSEAIGGIGVEVKATEVTDLVFLCAGILAGLLVGTLSLRVGGMDLTLGSGGGALLSGLVFGWLHSRKPSLGTFPASAVQILKDLGLAVFVACVGLSAGPDAIALIREHGAVLPLIGLAVSLGPACLSLWIGHKLLRIEGPLLVGAIAGQHVSTPAISAILAASQSSVPLLGYTITYAIANVLLPVLGPVIVSLAYHFT
ncbi:aspartate-alanine antiporter [Cupriavidus taiwanensis]|uniref:aspartate-alanine antiporter n=1 Tax=Cupriavidus taiwanensis TaxID=164546 RepID=UPI000E18DCD8|nr:aspartate-alanine antiporter [Cupriavidus taiwanensis]SOZ21193.1 putative transporter [Cupriavidus taiwanensis]SPA25597.1 putative transporter [Cupriavidus taiwanensis]